MISWFHDYSSVIYHEFWYDHDTCWWIDIIWYHDSLDHAQDNLSYHILMINELIMNFTQSPRNFIKIQPLSFWLDPGPGHPGHPGHPALQTCGQVAKNPSISMPYYGHWCGTLEIIGIHDMISYDTMILAMMWSHLFHRAISQIDMAVHATTAATVFAKTE